MITHDFKTQLADGQQGERFIDSVFLPEYTIRFATRAEQRQGIDRWFTRKGTGVAKAVEYKTDHRAFETGNAFVETTSVDTVGKQGWAFTSKADLLMYYLPEGGLIYILALGKLREALPFWASRYPKKAARNREYNTWGLCVPLHEFERYAVQVVNL